MLGREFFPSWEAWPKTVAEILELTKASKSQAHVLARRLKEMVVGGLWSDPGRPRTENPPGASVVPVYQAVQEYLYTHPGAVRRVDARFHYSDGFRHFILGLKEPGQPGAKLSIAQLAHTVGLPVETLREWFRVPQPQPLAAAPVKPDPVKEVHLRQITTLWQSWRGTFLGFCQMLKEQQRLPYGSTYVGNLLERVGLRKRKAQGQKEASWSSNTYRTCFPGAQWLGDGKTVQVYWDEECFTFNWEAILDVSSNALVGLSVYDAETSEAVVAAFKEGVATAGEAPSSLSLDNRPNNHCTLVSQALKELTALLRSTPYRGQAKAPLEGAFGLFEQSLPRLEISGTSEREIARSVLRLILIAWSRGRNGRPRKRLGGLSPADFYNTNRPTAEQVAETNRWLQELQRREKQARRTREERTDAVKLELLKVGLADLGIADPHDQLAYQLAYYSRDAIVAGLAVYDTRKQMGNLPELDQPGRYLGGIIRNLHDQRELEVMAEQFLRQRERLRDLNLAHLTSQAELIKSETHPNSLPTAFALKALTAGRSVDYHFWANQSGASLAVLPPNIRAGIYRYTARTIASTFRADSQLRQSLLACLARFVTDTF